MGPPVLSGAVDTSRHWSCGQAFFTSYFPQVVSESSTTPDRSCDKDNRCGRLIHRYKQLDGLRLDRAPSSQVAHGSRRSKVSSAQNALITPARQEEQNDAVCAPLRDNLDEIGFLRLPEVKSVTGLSKSSLYALIRTNSFPAPVQIGPRTVAWVRSEIKQWAAERIKASRTAVPAPISKREPQRATSAWPAAKKWA
jgi:prophage regulatory protein